MVFLIAFIAFKTIDKQFIPAQALVEIGPNAPFDGVHVVEQIVEYLEDAVLPELWSCELTCFLIVYFHKEGTHIWTQNYSKA